MNQTGPLISAVIFALVYVLGKLVDVAHFKHRRRWISAAAGVSVAYIFVYVLPELAEHQARLLESVQGSNPTFAETVVYQAAMFGFVLFYGVDTMVGLVKSSERAINERQKDAMYRVHIGGFAVYSMIVGYLLVDWTRGLQSLILYTIAFALHLLVVDHSLREEYGALYDSSGRWLLAASVLLGWLIGTLFRIDPEQLAILVGFTSGAVVMNSIKDELPRTGEGKFLPFFLGALIYSILIALL